jgi:hypothetical protein
MPPAQRGRTNDLRMQIRAISGANACCALVLQAGGRRFDPGWLHSRSACKWAPFRHRGWPAGSRNRGRGSVMEASRTRVRLPRGCAVPAIGAPAFPRSRRVHDPRRTQFLFERVASVLEFIHSSAGDGSGWPVFRRGVPPAERTLEAPERLASCRHSRPAKPAGRGPRCGPRRGTPPDLRGATAITGSIPVDS